MYSREPPWYNVALNTITKGVVSHRLTLHLKCRHQVTFILSALLPNIKIQLKAALITANEVMHTFASMQINK